MREFKILNSKKKLLNIIEADCRDISGVIIRVHGIGSHFQKLYENEDNIEYLSTLFEPLNIKCFGLEFHGHGKSEGLRCSVDCFDDLVDDLDSLVNYINENYKNIPIFIIGESLGGAVTIVHSIKYTRENICGCVLLAPMCGIDESLHPNKILKPIFEKISYLLPTYQMFDTTDKIKDACQNNKYNRYKKKSIYNYNELARLNTARECYNVCNWIDKNSHLFNKNVFIIHGEDDKITSCNLSIDFYNKIESKNKEIYLPKNTNHSVLIGLDENDIHPKFVWVKVMIWIKSIMDQKHNELLTILPL